MNHPKKLDIMQIDMFSLENQLPNRGLLKRTFKKKKERESKALKEENEEM